MRKYTFTRKRVLRAVPSKRWNKRGQFFLIAAVVTIMVLFTLTAKYNTIRQSTALQDFKELSEGYTAEQPKVVNLAIAQNKDEAERLQKFTKDYAAYAQGKEPSYGILYAYRDSRGSIHIVNTLGERAINIEFKDVDGKDAQIQLIGNEQVSGSINLDIGGQTFGTTVKTDVANYGEGITSTELSNIQAIRIVMPDGSRIRIDEYFNEFKETDPNQQLNTPAGQTYIQALEETSLTGGGKISATITGFAVSDSSVYTSECGLFCSFLRNIKALAVVI